MRRRTGRIHIDTNTGAITGTVTGSAQTYSNVVVTITDAASVAVPSATFTWTVLDKPTITPVNQTTTLGAGIVNVTLPSTCPNSPCTFTMTGAPTALTINAGTGVISGTVTGTTQTTVVVTIKDAANVSVPSSPFTWTVLGKPTVTSPGPRPPRSARRSTCN